MGTLRVVHFFVTSASCEGLDLELYPYLPRVRVNTTSAGDYIVLLSGRVAWTGGPPCSWNTT